MTSPDSMPAAESSSWDGLFGIGGYWPVCQRGLEAIAATHGARLTSLLGRTLEHAWVLWEVEADSWFADAPVVFDFGDEQLEVQHHKLDELSITWNTIDALAPVAWPESELVWRDDAIPDLERLHGQRVAAGELLEWLFGRPRPEYRSWFRGHR